MKKNIYSIPPDYVIVKLKNNDLFASILEDKLNETTWEFVNDVDKASIISKQAAADMASCFTREQLDNIFFKGASIQIISWLKFLPADVYLKYQTTFN